MTSIFFKYMKSFKKLYEIFSDNGSYLARLLASHLTSYDVLACVVQVSHPKQSKVAYLMLMFDNYKIQCICQWVLELETNWLVNIQYLQKYSDPLSFSTFKLGYSLHF